MKQILILLLSLLTLTAGAKSGNGRQRVELQTTMGSIVVELYNETPLHRDNFIKLVKGGVYDSLLFHRVIASFMIQAGDTSSRHAKPGQRLGNGELGYTLPAEIVWPQYYHRRGVLAAAREGDDVNPERRSSASQFYIVWGKKFSPKSLSDVQARLTAMTDGEVELTTDQREEYESVGGAPHLDGQYTVFGEVISGLDVVKAIQGVATDKNNRPLQDVRIIKARVIVN